jgi:hypothetical protein
MLVSMWRSSDGERVASSVDLETSAIQALRLYCR